MKQALIMKQTLANLGMLTRAHNQQLHFGNQDTQKHHGVKRWKENRNK